MPPLTPYYNPLPGMVGDPYKERPDLAVIPGNLTLPRALGQSGWTLVPVPGGYILRGGPRDIRIPQGMDPAAAFQLAAEHTQRGQVPRYTESDSGQRILNPAYAQEQEITASLAQLRAGQMPRQPRRPSLAGQPPFAGDPGYPGQQTNILLPRQPSYEARPSPEMATVGPYAGGRVPGERRLSSLPKYKIRSFKKGGYVDRPTIAVLGENGPEAVVPLPVPDYDPEEDPEEGVGGPPDVPPYSPTPPKRGDIVSRGGYDWEYAREVAYDEEGNPILDENNQPKAVFGWKRIGKTSQPRATRVDPRGAYSPDNPYKDDPVLARRWEQYGDALVPQPRGRGGRGGGTLVNIYPEGVKAKTDAQIEDLLNDIAVAQARQALAERKQDHAEAVAAARELRALQNEARRIGLDERELESRLEERRYQREVGEHSRKVEAEERARQAELGYAGSRRADIGLQLQERGLVAQERAQGAAERQAAEAQRQRSQEFATGLETQYRQEAEGIRRTRTAEQQERDRWNRRLLGEPSAVPMRQAYPGARRA